MQGKCFICANLTEQGEILSQNESCIVLQEIFGLPKSHTTRSIMERFQKVCYCPECLQRLWNIQLWTSAQIPELEETLKKEQKILWKDLLRNCTQVKGESSQPPLGMLQLLRNEIIAAVRKCAGGRCDIFYQNQRRSSDAQVNFDDDDDSGLGSFTQSDTLETETRDTVFSSSEFLSESSKRTDETTSEGDGYKSINIDDNDVSHLEIFDGGKDKSKPCKFFSDLRHSSEIQSDKLLRQKEGSKPKLSNEFGEVLSTSDNLKTYIRSKQRRQKSLKRKCEFKVTRMQDRSEESGKNFDCDDCKASFKDLAHLLRHKEIHSRSGRYKCKWCSAKFNQLAHVGRHEYKNHLDKKMNQPTDCDICGKNFANKQDWQLHVKEKHLDEAGMQYRCNFCDFYCKRPTTLRNHLLIHPQHSDMNIPGVERKSKISKPVITRCEECGSIFFTSFALKRHILCVHRKERKFKCEYCDYKTNDNAKLDLHTKYHSGSTDFQCDKCQASFNNLVALSAHKRNSHMESSPYKCKSCSLNCGSPSLLRKHNKSGLCVGKTNTDHETGKTEETHSDEEGSKLKRKKKKYFLGEKKYQCSLCLYKCNEPHLLRQHMRGRHSDERKFECDVCKFKFKRPDHLARHKKTHSGPTPFQCKLCLAKFRSRRSLQEHERGGRRDSNGGLIGQCSKSQILNEI